MKVCPHCSGAYPVAEGFCPMDGTRLRTLHATDGGGPIEPSDAYAGTLIGAVLDRRYRLDALIGEGGMGLVFRATHVLIGKSLAVKLLRREHFESPDVARRFLLEARVASSLKHPNVVEISDFGEIPEGGAYYVMELLEGRTLANAIDRDGPMSPTDAVITVAQICAGLGAAHALGVVHRDLKPDNVFLCDPRHGAEHPTVKLLDFGIARAGPRRITVSGSVLGTPEYMSPEMAQGHDVDHRADLYALGVILFELLTGTVPFYNKEIAKTLELHVFGERPSLASRKPELARLPRIGELVASLLAIERDQRPPDAGAVLRMLRAAWSQDLDAEAAAVVQRATLAIGSNRLPELGGGGRAAPWPAAPQWPQQPQALPSDAVATPGRGPSPEPHSPTFVLPVPRPRPSGARPALIALSTAAVACALTLGLAKWLQTPAATAADLAPTPPTPSEAIAPAAPAIEPAVARPPPAAEPAIEPAAIREPEAQDGPSEPPTPPPPTGGDEVIPIATATPDSDAKTPAPVDRSKAKRKRGAQPPDQGTGTTPPSSAAPATTESPKAPPSEPKPHPEPTSPPAFPPPFPRSPADLKDPFPAK
jgi:serine/threonine protein kinase